MRVVQQWQVVCFSTIMTKKINNKQIYYWGERRDASVGNINSCHGYPFTQLLSYMSLHINTTLPNQVKLLHIIIHSFLSPYFCLMYIPVSWRQKKEKSQDLMLKETLHN